MKVLFIHQNMPGQFRHLATALAARGHEVVFITRRENIELPGVRKVVYKPHREANAEMHPYLRQTEDAVLHGQQVLRVCQELGGQGFIPNLIIGHPGWGETLFVRECFVDVPLLAYCEFYFRPNGPLDTFDPQRPKTVDQQCRIRTGNAHLLLALEAADMGWSPTDWQRSQFPDFLQPKIRTVFDGFDTGHVRPDPLASFALPDGRVLTAADEVITYVSRNLEPTRGFPTFMRALPEILKRRLNATVVIAGGDGVSYIGRNTAKEPWREIMLREVDMPEGRVHFVGQLPYSRYLSLLQVSSAHVYLTVPFVLSWSFMEAMAAGCLIVASDTAPVREVAVAGQTAYLTDFFSHEHVAHSVVAALADPYSEGLRHATRETAIAKYGLDVCLPQQLQMLKDLTGHAW